MHVRTRARVRVRVRVHVHSQVLPAYGLVSTASLNSLYHWAVWDPEAHELKWVPILAIHYVVSAPYHTVPCVVLLL